MSTPRGVCGGILIRIALIAVIWYNIHMEDNTKNKIGSFKVWETLLTCLIPALALAAFCLWVFTAEELTVQGTVTACISLGIFTVALMIAVPAFIRFFRGEDAAGVRPLGDRSMRRSRLHPVIGVMLSVLAARFIVSVLAYVIFTAIKGYSGSFFATAERIWYKLDTDAPHYFSIAEQGYTTVEPQMYNIVFLPLFPWLIRALNLIFRSSFVSAAVINTLATCGAAALIYQLALCDTGRRSARIAVLFAVAMPAAIFFIAPMSEPLFLLLSAGCLLAARKGKFFLGAVLGALASFTRSVGIIMLLPFVMELILFLIKKKRKEEIKTSAAILKAAACIAIFCLGTFGYLLINKIVWGEWFKFLEFQKSIWYQQAGPFFGTVSTQTNYLFRSFGSETADLLGLWLPNLLYIFGALSVLVLTARTLRSSYTLYFAAYLAITCGATWLLSAPRYLTALVVLPLALAHLCQSRDDGVALGRSRAKTTAVTVLLLLGQAAYLVMYILEYSIY